MLPVRTRSTVRQDIADMIRLIRYVEARRAALAVAGGTGGVAEVDELLRKLRAGLRLMLPLRRRANGAPRPTLPAARPPAGLQPAALAQPAPPPPPAQPTPPATAAAHAAR